MSTKDKQKSYVKHVSFANSTRQERIRALQSNKHTNIRLRHKSLNNVEALDKALIKEKSQTVVEELMEVKKNGIHLFVGVEQGSGKNQTNTHACFKPNMATEAKNWISQNFGTTLTISGKKEFVTTLTKVNKKEESRRNELNDCVVDRLKVVTIAKKKQPKQKTCLEIATGKEVADQKVEKNEHEEK